MKSGRFSKTDCQVIAEAFEEDFSRFIANVAPLIEIQNSVETAEFRPYPDKPEIRIPLVIKNRFNPTEAKKYMKYLGFDDTFAVNLVTRQREGRVSMKVARLGLKYRVTNNHVMVYLMAMHIREQARGKKLQQILMEDPRSKQTWSEKCPNPSDWKQIAVSETAAFNTADQLFRNSQYSIANKIKLTKDGLINLRKKGKRAQLHKSFLEIMNMVYEKEYGITFFESGFVMIKEKNPRNPSGLVVHAIDEAKSKIILQTDLMVLHDLAEALGRARRREVKVHVLLENIVGDNWGDVVDILAESGITFSACKQFTSTTNNLMIIDDNKVVDGWFRFDPQGTHPSLISLTDITKMDRTYLEEFDRVLRNSKMLRRVSSGRSGRPPRIQI